MVTGSLQIKNDTYYVVVRIPDDTGNKKQKWISTDVKVVGNNKRKAIARMREIIVDIEQQKIIYSTETKFLDWIDKWMAQKKNEVRLNTFESYESYLNTHIIPFFKPLNLALNKVSPQHIQDFYNKKRARGISANSIKRFSVVIRGALQDAMKKNMIPYNPTDRATLPAKAKFVGKAYTVEQANRLLKVIDDEPMKPAIILGLFYGLRRSEVLGLRWKDIDFDNDVMHICNTVVRTKTIIEAEQTKSDASKRALYIIPETREYLLSLKKQQSENRKLMGNSFHVNDYVCTWSDGRPFVPNYLTQRFVKILAKNKLPRIRFHELRHTAGSLLLSRGLSAKQIQEYLGHERVSTTLDLYGHLTLEGKKETSLAMGNMLEIGGF